MTERPKRFIDPSVPKLITMMSCRPSSPFTIIGTCQTDEARKYVKALKGLLKEHIKLSAQVSCQTENEFIERNPIHLISASDQVHWVSPRFLINFTFLVKLDPLIEYVDGLGL